MSNTSIPVLRYSRTARLLHWSIAALLFVTFALGVVLDNSRADALKFALVQWHAPLGTLVALLTLARAYFAFKHLRPQPDASWSPLVKWAAKITHILLYVLPLVLVITGLGIMSLGGVTDLLLSGQTQSWPLLNELAARQGHGLVSKILLAAIALHIAGAIYHQRIVKDNLLARMR